MASSSSAKSPRKPVRELDLRWFDPKKYRQPRGADQLDIPRYAGQRWSGSYYAEVPLADLEPDWVPRLVFTGYLCSIRNSALFKHYAITPGIVTWTADGCRRTRFHGEDIVCPSPDWYLFQVVATVHEEGKDGVLLAMGHVSTEMVDVKGVPLAGNNQDA
jgi:hypothetical protein